MQKLLQELILNFQNDTRDSGTRRALNYEAIKGKAFICIGVRRCGKSTFLYQIIDDLFVRGVDKTNILYIDFFDDRLMPLKHGGVRQVLDAYYSLYPEKKGTETVYYFFDEIQEMGGWEPFIANVLASEKCEVYISGSSAKTLSREIATQMRGRSLAWEMFPFSFSEYCKHRKVPEGALTTKRRLALQKAFSEYADRGGFPETIDLPEHLRVKIHQEYFKTIMNRDVIERNDAPHPQSVMELGYRLINSTASLFTINRLYGYLKSLGHSYVKDFVSQCVQWFEDAYFLFQVRMYDASLARRNINPKKIYCVDHALVRSVTPGILVDEGHLLENMVFTHLRRKSADIFYYRSKKSGREADFVWIPNRARPRVVQVCRSLADPKTRKRELSGAAEAMVDLGLKEAVVVTESEEETISNSAGAISVVPAWKFLLDLADEPKKSGM